MARPELEISDDEVFKLAKLGCSNTEIAEFFECDESTIRKRFSEILTKGRAALKIRFRRKLLQMTFSGKHPVLMIWGSKNLIGWKDTPEPEQVKQVTPELRVVRPDLSKLGT